MFDAIFDGIFFILREMPTSHQDAMRLQAENLEEATHSRVASRVHSRLNSIAPSLINSAIQSRMASRPRSALGSTTTSRRGSLMIPSGGSLFDPSNVRAASSIGSEGSPETLENLIRVTQENETILQAYYTNDDGDLVTLSLYDISNTDPADILGADVVDEHLMDDAMDDEQEAINHEALCEKLQRHRRSRAQQLSGDSHNGSNH